MKYQVKKHSKRANYCEDKIVLNVYALFWVIQLKPIVDMEVESELVRLYYVIPFLLETNPSPTLGRW